MIVTNTKYSDYAMQYGVCRDILQIGWSTPANLSLQSMIEQENLYPLSCVRGLNVDTRMQLVDSGVVLINQMMNEDSAALARRTGLPQEVIRKVKEKIEPIDFSRY